MATRHLPLAGGHPQGFGATVRNDSWLLGPLLTIAVLLGFIVYVTWAMLQASHYYAEPYLSPLYSPLLFVKADAMGAAPVAHAWFGDWPNWWPEQAPASPALLVLAFPALLRFTCYYYRKAYYRAFVGSPPACAVGPAAQQRPYSGETKFLIFQNLHRYTLYLALPYPIILLWDSIQALFKNGELGIGVGTVILFVNTILLTAFTLGCHAFRHLIGGHDDCMSCGKRSLKYLAWRKASWLNARHMPFAWVSLVWVAGTDVYVRLVSMGIITDLNTWN
jgi:hypothetical protein